MIKLMREIHACIVEYIFLIRKINLVNINLHLSDEATKQHQTILDESAIVQGNLTMWCISTYSSQKGVSHKHRSIHKYLWHTFPLKSAAAAL